MTITKVPEGYRFDVSDVVPATPAQSRGIPMIPVAALRKKGSK